MSSSPAIERGQSRENSLVSQNSSAPLMAPEAIVRFLPRKIWSLLYQMAVIGDIMGIRDHVQRLEQEQAQLIPFVTKIRSFG